MNYFVGYPGYRGNREFDENPYGWLIHASEQVADVTTSEVFLIGWGRAAGSGFLVAYFPIRELGAVAAEPSVYAAIRGVSRRRG